jgi:hypothetical protein
MLVLGGVASYRLIFSKSCVEVAGPVVPSLHLQSRGKTDGRSCRPEVGRGICVSALGHHKRPREKNSKTSLLLREISRRDSYQFR